MGIVNLTPDSFSDGGELATADAVEAHVDASSRPPAPSSSTSAPNRRGPARRRYRPTKNGRGSSPRSAASSIAIAATLLRPRLSVDTYHVETARRALALGADIINDVSGLTTPAMIELAATSGAEFVAMHNLGVPADKTRTLPAERGSDGRRRAMARGAAHRMAARGARSRSHRLRSRHRLRQERAAIAAAVAQHRALSALTACACSSATRANRSCITSRPRSRRARSLHGRRVAAALRARRRHPARAQRCDARRGLSRLVARNLTA